MLEYLKDLPSAIYNHYHALTGIVFVAAMVKIFGYPCLYLIQEITNRVLAKRTAARFIKMGVPEAEAWKTANGIWRSEKEQPLIVRWLKRLFKLLFKRK